MTIATFDGPNKIIQLPEITDYQGQRDLYSAWKLWSVESNGINLQYEPAFDVTGGDTISSTSKVAPYFFVNNNLGWRIRMPQSESGEFILADNIFPRDADLPLFEQSPGQNAFLRQEVSSRAIVIETGVSGLTDQELKLLELCRLIPAGL